MAEGKAFDHPVPYINWYDAIKWCNARSEVVGRIPAYFTDASQTTVYRTGQLDLDEFSINWNSGCDFLVTSADASDSLTANLSYPSTDTGSAADKSLRPAFFNGTTWIPVGGSGNANPTNNTTDNLGGTVSGGRFAIVFDNTSTRKITQLSGTEFALANTAPVAPASLGRQTLWRWAAARPSR